MPVPSPNPRSTVPIPFLRNTEFVGRADELAQLHATLSGTAEPLGITGLTGMGGIGKTQLAVEYCYRYADAYPGGTFWVNAAEPLRRGLSALGQRLLEAEMEGGAEQQKLVALRRFIARAFSLEEIADLCFDLGISPEEVPGQTLSARARELVAYCQRQGSVMALIDGVEAARPHQDWRTGTPESQQRQIEAFVAHLQANSPALVVLDNLESPDLLEETLLPSLPIAADECMPLLDHGVFEHMLDETGRLRHQRLVFRSKRTRQQVGCDHIQAQARHDLLTQRRCNLTRIHHAEDRASQAHPLGIPSHGVRHLVVERIVARQQYAALDLNHVRQAPGAAVPSVQ